MFTENLLFYHLTNLVFDFQCKFLAKIVKKRLKLFTIIFFKLIMKIPKLKI